MSLLPDLIGRVIDIEEPPYQHGGDGMRCTLWSVHVYDTMVEAESDEGLGWIIGPATKITVVSPEYQTRRMDQRKMHHQRYIRDTAPL